jgi:two-component system, LytTR family, sensor kinase
MSVSSRTLPRTSERSLLSQYCKVLFIFSPLVTGGVSLAVSPPGMFWPSFRVAMTVALVTTSVSFAVIVAVMAFDRRRARSRGSSRGRLWYVGWSLLSMPLGLLASAEVTLLIFGFRAPASIADYRFGVFVGAAIMAGFFLWYARIDAEHAARLLQLRLEQAQAATLQAQLSTLTSQLNPHLLFNALNTIAALIPSDPQRAEQTVVHLAELYRGVLRATQRDEHELGVELAICKAYLEIEQARFGERLRVAFELEPGLDPNLFRVPVLILQPLIENAVKHGLASRSQGGRVNVRAERRAEELRLVVTDDGVGLGNSSHRGAGVGVDITRRRLQHLYGTGAALELEAPSTGGTRAVLRLPQARLPSEDASAGVRALAAGGAR